MSFWNTMKTRISDQPRKVLEEDVDRVDLEAAGEEVHPVHHAEPDQHRDGPRAADQVDAGVDEDGEDEDVEPILPAEPEDERPSRSATASATATTSPHRGHVVDPEQARSAGHRERHGGRCAVQPRLGPPSPQQPPMNPLRDTPTKNRIPERGDEVEPPQKSAVVLDRLFRTRYQGRGRWRRVPRRPLRRPARAPPGTPSPPSRRPL